MMRQRSQRLVHDEISRRPRTVPFGESIGNGKPDFDLVSTIAYGECAQRVAEVLGLLANQKRLMILCLLSEGDKHVDDLVKASCSSFSATSQQLKLLTLSGILDRRREGRNIYYRLKDGKVLAILEHLKEIYANQDSIPVEPL